MNEGLKWDGRYLSLAALVSTWSKDRSTRVGCVIVGNAGQVLATGYNGFPRGVCDDVDERHERPAKYSWTEHAERNAVFNAARTGVALQGATIYAAWYPCADCARAIIQSGITTLVALRRDIDNPRWKDDFVISSVMFEEAGVTVRWREWKQ